MSTCFTSSSSNTYSTAAAITWDSPCPARPKKVEASNPILNEMVKAGLFRGNVAIIGNKNHKDVHSDSLHLCHTQNGLYVYFNDPVNSFNDPPVANGYDVVLIIGLFREEKTLMGQANLIRYGLISLRTNSATLFVADKDINEKDVSNAMIYAGAKHVWKPKQLKDVSFMCLAAST